MSRLKSALVFTIAVGLAPALGAQPPVRQNPPNGGAQMGPPGGGPPPPPGNGPDAGSPGAMDPASMMLAHTGEFKLTDVQVTRLAAIARRAADRRKAMAPVLDSLRNANRPAPPQPGAAPTRQGPGPAARAQMDKMREAMHTDLKDAIAVLTPEQQAQGWEMMARRGRGGPGGPAGMGGRQGGIGGPQGAPPQDGGAGPRDQLRPPRRPPMNGGEPQ